MKIVFSQVKTLLMFFFLLTIGSLICGCSEVKYPVEPAPIHAIRFTDNDVFNYDCPEEIIVSSQEQVVTLRIKSISIKPDSYIMDRPDNLTFKATAVPQELSDEFYNVREVTENGEALIEVSLKPNDTDQIRAVAIDIYCELPKIDNSLYGLVTIVQQPIEEEHFSLKIKYKGSYYYTDAYIDKNGEHVYEDSDFI